MFWKEKNVNFRHLYAQFDAPVAALDCGDRCAPYNARGVPFCCDTLHAVPVAYQAEWEYLQANTDLWHPWQGENPEITQELNNQASPGQVLIACQGARHCQRNFRSLTCRAFPFFPYLNRQGEFLGMAYYWEYEDRCWVISNLQVVSSAYRRQFIAAYDMLFEHMSEERQTFQHQSNVMRRVFGQRKRSIPLLHRNGSAYKVSPKTGRLRRVPVEALPKFGPYKIAADLPFPDELPAAVG